MKPELRRILTAVAALLVTGMAIFSLWRAQTAPRGLNQALHRGLGERLAEEVAAEVGASAELVVVTLERGTSDVLDVQVEAFHRHLQRWPGLRVVRTDTVDGDKGDKYGPGTGLSARRWQRLVEKEPGAKAIVSFLGTPDPEDLPAKTSTVGRPRLIAVSRSPKELAVLIERGLLSRALVPRFSFPAPGPETPRTPAEWFDNRFQVVSAASVAAK